MKNSDIRDPLFLEAVEAIDSGNAFGLQELLMKHPYLVSERLDYPEDGYFKDPYLLFFVADNPIRHEKLPANIADITRILIDAVRKNAPESFREQMDYTLGLVATGYIPKKCGVQIELINLLIDQGAVPGNGHGALAHGNIDAARRLIERGGDMTLTTAICLDLQEDIESLAERSTVKDRQIALMAAAFYGRSDMLSFLIDLGVDVNAYIEQDSGFHWHATALHQAVSSGSLEAVKVLLEAGASLQLKDRVYDGTPLGWAMYMQEQENDEVSKRKYVVIEKYLRGH